MVSSSRDTVLGSFAPRASSMALSEQSPRIENGFPDPQKDLKIRSLEP